MQCLLLLLKLPSAREESHNPVFKGSCPMEESNVLSFCFSCQLGSMKKGPRFPFARFPYPRFHFPS